MRFYIWCDCQAGVEDPASRDVRRDTMGPQLPMVGRCKHLPHPTHLPAGKPAGPPRGSWLVDAEMDGINQHSAVVVVYSGAPTPHYRLLPRARG